MISDKAKYLSYIGTRGVLLWLAFAALLAGAAGIAGCAVAPGAAAGGGAAHVTGDAPDGD